LCASPSGCGFAREKPRFVIPEFSSATLAEEEQVCFHPLVGRAWAKWFPPDM
jgi:hypothetical protein